MDVEHVPSAEDKLIDLSIKVRFVPVVNNTGNEKMPKFRCQVSLPAGLSGLVLEAPIFKDAKTGKFTVAIPGGSFSVLKAEPMEIEHNGHKVQLADPDPIGQRKLDGWSSAILTAFYAYETSKNPVQRLTL